MRQKARPDPDFDPDFASQREFLFNASFDFSVLQQRSINENNIGFPFGDPLLVQMLNEPLLTDKTMALLGRIGVSSLSISGFNGDKEKIISCLSGMTDLRHLDISRSTINDLSWIVKLDNLVSINASYIGLTDISPLAKLARLERINMTHSAVTDNPVSDISPLAGLKNLAYLAINETKVVDLSALSKLPKLKLVWVPKDAKKIKEKKR